MVTSLRDAQRQRRQEALGFQPLSPGELSTASRNLEDSAFYQRDAKKTTRLWDVIGQCWTQEFETGFAMTCYTRMLAYRCTACTEASLYPGEITQHIRRVTERARDHETAQVGEERRGDSVMPSCTACRVTFQRGRHWAERHIQDIRQAPSLHNGARELLIQRYTLAPPVFRPVIMEAPQVAGMGPVASQVERSRPRRKRHRRGRGNRE